MAYGIVHFFPGGTHDQYHASVAAVHPAPRLPEGQIFHAAGASEGGRPECPIVPQLPHTRK